MEKQSVSFSVAAVLFLGVLFSQSVTVRCQGSNRTSKFFHSQPDNCQEFLQCENNRNWTQNCPSCLVIDVNTGWCKRRSSVQECRQKSIRCQFDCCSAGTYCLSDQNAPNGFKCVRGTAPVCLSNPCRNNGRCGPSYDKNGEMKFHCDCSDGFTGSTCEQRSNRCSPNPCLNNGQCNVDYANSQGYRCNCQRGFSGQNCEQRSNRCSSNPCLNNGECFVDYSNSQGYGCNCQPGFSGQNCEQGSTACQVNSCFNGGQCVPSGTGFTCNCRIGFSGDRCQFVPGGNVCQDKCNGGTCTPNENTYTCTNCPAGLTGPNCQQRRSKCTAGRCVAGFYCVEVDTGISQAGYACVPDTNNNKCSPNPCNNGRCQPSFTDVRGYTCTCPTGVTGIDCQTQVTNRCAPNPCNSGTCQPSSTVARGYTCLCPAGVTGIKCQFTTACFPNPCNGGTCSLDGTSFRCANCPAGKTGPTCSQDVNICQPNPCSRGLVCRATQNGYTCTVG